MAPVSLRLIDCSCAGDHCLDRAGPGCGAAAPDAACFDVVGDGPARLLLGRAPAAPDTGQTLGHRCTPAVEHYVGDPIERGSVGPEPFPPATPSRYVYLVLLAAPPGDRAEVDSWYEQEHTPLLTRAAGWDSCRRYALRPRAGQAYTLLAVHGLSTLTALDSAERAQARATAWTARLRQRPWFGRSLHLVYQLRTAHRPAPGATQGEHR